MRKNGFTMVELIAIVVIMASMLLIILPSINNTIKQSEEKKKEEALNNIYMAAENFLMDNYEDYKIDNAGDTTYVYITDLINNNYMNINATNPNNDSSFNNKDAVKIVRNNDNTFYYELITLKTIYDVVISNFPYLETEGNGCVTPSYNNYSYMGGCYLKGSSSSGKDMFYTVMNRNFGIDNDTINNNFFDSNGNFVVENFDNYMIPYFSELMGISEEELRAILQEFDKTFFEFFILTYFDMSMTPDEFFSYQPLNNNYIWYSGFLWQIMGINADGTVRLITNENVTSIPWGEENKVPNWDESYANDWLNNYFYPTLEAKEIIKEQIWCSEVKNQNSSVTTECTNNSSTNPSYVGLLTMDEFTIAGATNSYLFIQQAHWSMTPYLTSYVYEIFDSMNVVSPYKSSSSVGIRPVINIKSDVIVSGGNGILDEKWDSLTGPYFFKDNQII